MNVSKGRTDKLQIYLQTSIIVSAFILNKNTLLLICSIVIHTSPRHSLHTAILNEYSLFLSIYYFVVSKFLKFFEKLYCIVLFDRSLFCKPVTILYSPCLLGKAG